MVSQKRVLLLLFMFGLILLGVATFAYWYYLQQWIEFRDLYHAHYRDTAYLLMISGMVCIIASVALFTRISSELNSQNILILKKCSYCGEALMEDMKLCPYCGETLKERKEKNSLLTNLQANVPVPIQQVQQLESEKEALGHELWKYISKPSEIIGYVFLLFGAISLMVSIIYVSSILAFIGLGLTFWGALLLFTRPTKYVKVNLLNSTAISSLTTINQIINDFKCKGKAIYLPPKYLKELKSATVFIPSKKETIIPPVEEVAEEKVFLKNPNGICLTPPGLSLVNLYEKELGKDFAKVNLNYLQYNLPKLFIEDLEIAEDLEMNIEGKMVQIKITGSIYKDLCEEVRKLPNIHGSLGCPLCSSIAIALARATGKPVIIEKIPHSEDDKTIQTYYRLLGTIEKVSAPFKPSGKHLGYLLPSLVGLVLAAFGLIILVWVGWLTWYDINGWSKSLALIFFGSRTGEAISLGIDMRLIYYLLIGSALFLSGIFMFFRKRQRAHVEE